MSPKQMDPISPAAQAAAVSRSSGQSSAQCRGVFMWRSQAARQVSEKIQTKAAEEREKILQLIFRAGINQLV